MSREIGWGGGAREVRPPRERLQSQEAFCCKSATAFSTAVTRAMEADSFRTAPWISLTDSANTATALSTSST